MGHPFVVGEQLTKAMPPDVMGKGVPLAEIYNKDHKRYNEGVDFRALVETEPHFKEIVDTAIGLEGLKRQWGVHAAGVIMSSEPLIDVIPIMRRLQDGQVITQFDYPSCEALGLVKMDFLGLRNLTILDDAIDNVRANRGEDDRPRRAVQGHDRQGDLRPAVARRHPRGLPARRRRHAHPAQAHAARQLRGHLGGPRALPARADGRQRPHQLRAAQERQAGARPPRPAAQGQAPAGDGRRPRADPRHDLRPGDLPGAGHGDRPEARRLHPRQRRPAAPGDGQEEEGGPRRRVRPLLRGDEGQRLQRGLDRGAVGRARARSPTTRSTRRTRRPTGWCPTGPATSRPTTRPSTWPPC